MLVACLSPRYNPEYYAQFEQLHIPILQDNDEWDHYQSVKKDPVLHVEVITICWHDG